MIAKKEIDENELVQVAARITRDKYTELKITAAKENKFINDLITEGIEHVLKKYKSK